MEHGLTRAAHTDFFSICVFRVRNLVSSVPMITPDRILGIKGIAALDEMLADPTPKIRGVVMVVIYKAYERAGYDMPSSLLDTVWRLGRSDPNRCVRQTALVVLQRLGHVSYKEAMEYLE